MSMGECSEVGGVWRGDTLSNVKSSSTLETKNQFLRGRKRLGEDDLVQSTNDYRTSMKTLKWRTRRGGNAGGAMERCTKGRSS